MMTSRTLEFLGHAVGSAVGSAIGSAANGRHSTSSHHETNNTTVNTTVINNYGIPPIGQTSNQPQLDVQPQNLDLKCPNCMGERSLDEHNMVLHCPYCDSREIIAPNQLEAYRRLLGISANTTETQYSAWRPVNQPAAPVSTPAMTVPQGNYTACEQPQKKKTWLWVLDWIFIFPVPVTILMLRNRNINTVLKYTAIALAWSMYFLIGIVKNSGENEFASTRSSEIPASASAIELEGEDYEDVERRMRAAGFDNIELKPMGDLITGWVTTEGEVEKISINGVTDFNKYDKFPPNAVIVITYHSFETDDSSEENIESEPEIVVDSEITSNKQKAG